MAAEARWKDHPVVRKIRKAPQRYSFFQAVHLLQSSFPEAPRVGGQGPPHAEVLRFRSHLSLGFPSSDVIEVEPVEQPGGGPRIEVTAAFLGLYGPASPLPSFYTERLLDRELDDSRVRDFLDLFHHRLLSLFYRVWEKYCYTVQFQRDGTDEVSRRLLCLVGHTEEVVEEDRRIPPVRLLAYVGLLTQLPRSASNLHGVLRDYFEGVPLEIEQCVPRMQEIPGDQRNRLGVRNTRLGASASLGARVNDQSSTFRIRMGPLSLEDFQRFLPGGPGRAELLELVDLFNIDPLDFELELWIRSVEIPPLELSGAWARLGWSSWLGGRPARDQYARFFCRCTPHGYR